MSMYTILEKRIEHLQKHLRPRLWRAATWLAHFNNYESTYIITEHSYEI